MKDLHEALAEIAIIRGQMARSAEFQGYGLLTLAMTAGFTVLAALGQGLVVRSPADAGAYIMLWVGVAALSVAAIAIEVVARSRRIHSGLAGEMIQAAAEQLIPACVAGALITTVLWRSAPDSLWMLPGLWQIILSLGIFASVRFLPPRTFMVAAWYLFAGLACLVFANGGRALSPWAMAVPFGVGQLWAAYILFTSRRMDEAHG